MVDLPFEEENEIIHHLDIQKLDLIKLIAPTTSIERASKILKNSSGFVYLISMLGITGTKSAKIEDNKKISRISKKYANFQSLLASGFKNHLKRNNLVKLALMALLLDRQLLRRCRTIFQFQKF